MKAGRFEDVAVWAVLRDDIAGTLQFRRVPSNGPPAR
jgi:hypothetical protein